MSDHPILFSGPMVRALLEGRKTQMRRVLKSQPPAGVERVFGPEWYEPEVVDRRGELVPGKPVWGVYDEFGVWGTKVPFVPGDRLWVRETWTARMTHGWTIADARSRMYQEEILYQADGEKSIDGWWPSIHMPREFSRLTLVVTDVRVQRLQEISEADAWAEGAPKHGASRVPMEVDERGYGSGWRTARSWFDSLWDSLNADRGYSWAANPWVVAVSFSVERRNIDHG